MSDEPEETKWEGFVRKAKYQMGKGQDEHRGTWDDMLHDALDDGFMGNYDDAIDTLDQILQNSYERLEKGTRTNAFSAKATALEKLGKTDEQRNTIISKVLAHLDKIDFQLENTEIVIFLIL